MVEDAAQAQGATRGQARAGAHGVAAASASTRARTWALGDAGVVVTSTTGWRRRSAAARPRPGWPGHHDHGLLGLNSRLDAVQAVVLAAKLRHLDAWNAARADLMAVYRDLLDPDVAPLVGQLKGGRGAPRRRAVLDRARVREELAAAGVATGIHYPTPCHLMTPYAGYADGPLPVAESAAAQVLSLPLYPHLRVEDVEQVAKTVNAIAPRRSGR